MHTYTYIHMDECVISDTPYLRRFVLEGNEPHLIRVEQAPLCQDHPFRYRCDHTRHLHDSALPHIWMEERHRKEREQIVPILHLRCVNWHLGSNDYYQTLRSYLPPHSYYRTQNVTSFLATIQGKMFATSCEVNSPIFESRVAVNGLYMTIDSISCSSELNENVVS